MKTCTCHTRANQDRSLHGSGNVGLRKLCVVVGIAHGPYEMSAWSQFAAVACRPPRSETLREAHLCGRASLESGGELRKAQASAQHCLGGLGLFCREVSCQACLAVSCQVSVPRAKHRFKKQSGFSARAQSRGNHGSGILSTHREA